MDINRKELMVDSLGHYYIGIRSVSKEEFDKEYEHQTLQRIEQKLDKLITNLIN